MKKQILLDCGEIRPHKQSICTALRRETNLKCLILTLLILAAVVATVWWCGTTTTVASVELDEYSITTRRTVSPCSDGYVYIPSAFIFTLYLLYLVECWHSKARELLSLPKTDINTVYRKVHQMRLAKPVIWWKAICYHYIKRRKHYTRLTGNQAAFTHSEICYERVNSHVATSTFFYGLCGMNDISRDLVDLGKFAVTKVRFQKGFIFSNSQTAMEFEDQRAIFFQDQEGCDDYLEMKEGLELANVAFQENMTAWTSPDKLPWFARPTVFWMFSFLLLSWPLRIILELNTAHVRYQITKIFGTNYASPDCTTTDPLTATIPVTQPLPDRRPRFHFHPSRLLRRVMRNYVRKSCSPTLNLEEKTYLLLSSSSDYSPSPRPTSPPLELDGSPATRQSDDGVNSQEGRGQLERAIVKSLESEACSKGKLSPVSYHPPHYNYDSEGHHHYNFPWFSPSRNEYDTCTSKESGRDGLPRSVTLLLPQPDYPFENLALELTDSHHFTGNDHKKNHEYLRENAPHNNNHFGRQSSHSSALNKQQSSWNLIPTYSEALLLLEGSGESRGESAGYPGATFMEQRPGMEESRSSATFTVSNYPLSLSNTPALTATGSESVCLPAQSYRTGDYGIISKEEQQRKSLQSGQNLTFSPPPPSHRVQTPLQNSKHMGPHPQSTLNSTFDQANDGQTYESFHNQPPSLQQHLHQLSSTGNAVTRSFSTFNFPNLKRSESFRALRQSLPRSMTGIPVDLTHPASASVPFDPYKESRTVWDLNSGREVSRPSSSSNRILCNSEVAPPLFNARPLEQPLSSDSPPDYIEALKTSRPAALPPWARLRRCLTERNLWDRRRSTHSKVWLQQVTPTFLQTRK